jgi:uncharacterized membrane protein (UPF0136 family)
MNKTNKTLLIVYTLLLLSGGFMGYMKTHSQVSLVMSGAFSAVLLSLLLMSKKIKNSVSYVAMVLLCIDSFFTYRFLKTWKLMPSGLFAAITFLALITFIKTSDQTQNKVQREP